MNFVYLHKSHQPLKMLNLDQIKSISIKHANNFEYENEKVNVKSAVSCLVEFDGAHEAQAFSVIFVNEEKENYITEAIKAVYNHIGKAVWNGEKHIDVVITIGKLTF